jgi:hypothetical protein
MRFKSDFFAMPIVSRPFALLIDSLVYISPQKSSSFEYLLGKLLCLRLLSGLFIASLPVFRTFNSLLSEADTCQNPFINPSSIVFLSFSMILFFVCL